jgi:site-specific recombinase XerD
MKPAPMYQMGTAEVRRALARHIDTLEHCAPTTRQVYLREILDFLAFMQHSSPRVVGHLFVTERQLMEWLRDICRQYSVSAATQRLERVEHFMAAMRAEGAIGADPIAALKAQYGARGRRGIIEALCSTDPRAALEALRREPLFTGSFGHQARSYLELHRAAGGEYRAPGLTLAEFNRFLRARATDSITAVTPALVQEWCASMSCSRHHARSKLLRLRKFFCHAVRLGVIRSNPVTRKLLDEMRAPARDFRPFIFSHEQVAAVLKESMKLQPNPMFPLRPETVHTIIRLLYTLGLRLGEALGLQMRDIDMDQSTLRVRGAKFHKERLVPFGPRLGEHLKRYLDLRRQTGAPVRGDDPLFLGWRRIGHQREALDGATIRKAFHEVLHSVGITTPAGYGDARLHDLRHTFAVHRLLRWYKEGVEVQNRLVLLATFMGHSTIFSSQVYLTITGSLLNEANQRFQNSFGDLVSKEQRP